MRDDLNYVLLVGAGFSRNWGGWLADDVTYKLRGRLSDHPELDDLLNLCGSSENERTHSHWPGLGTPACPIP